MKPRAVVLMTPRSGSSYMTRLLRCTGIYAGHEEVYRQDNFQGWKGWEVDVTPWFYPDTSVERRIHVVRDPRKVIPSMAATGVITQKDDIIEAARTWRELTKQYRLMQTNWFRIEDVCFGPGSYRRFLEALMGQRQWISDHLAAALAYVPTDYNTRPHEILEWKDLPPSVVDLGKSFQYE